MTPNNRPFGLRIALCVLQWCLSVVILIEATFFSARALSTPLPPLRSRMYFD